MCVLVNSLLLFSIYLMWEIIQNYGEKYIETIILIIILFLQTDLFIRIILNKLFYFIFFGFWRHSQFLLINTAN